MNKKNNGGSFATVLDDIFSSSFADILGASVTQSTPKVNILKTDEGYQVQVAAPGYSRDDFQITIEDDQLYIKSEKETTDSGESSVRKEFNFGSFTRSFGLAADIDKEKVEAKYTDGILNITLHKLKEEKQKDSFTIQVD